MKKLFFFLSFLALALGAWAGPDDPYEFEATTWIYDSQHSNAPENVLRIKVRTGGALAQAYDEISATGWYFEKDNGPENPKTQLSLSDFKVVHIENDVKPNSNPNDVALNVADLDVLPNFQFETIDLQDAFYYLDGEKSAFIFQNSNVKNLILPDGWTKAEVTACAYQVGTNLNSAISITPVKQGEGPQTEYVDGATMHAYIQKGNTLDLAIHHLITDTEHNNTKLMVQGNQWDAKVSKLKYLSVTGNVTARDLSSGEKRFDKDGHFVFNEPALEQSYAMNMGLSGSVRTLSGDYTWVGALDEAKLIELDLRDAIIENYEDLTMGYLGILYDSYFKNLIIPIDPNFNILPADFMNIALGKVQSILIPRNIQVISTRAFASLVNLKHVYTEGDSETTVYDNGAVCGFDENGEELKLYGEDAVSAQLLYGTITLGGNIKKIETAAFYGQTQIKDVYVLALPTPECHVDAFNTIQYVANDAYDRSAITDGIITRDAYTNNKNNYTFMAMLHYPREAETPDIQRYTDVTRTYSVATGLRDGKGAVLYMPNQAEYCRAYLQGTYGYLWNAWDPTRSSDGNNGFANTTVESTIRKDQGYYMADGQSVANDAYVSNNYQEIDKTDRSFYDVTKFGELVKPSDLKDYWETKWPPETGAQLYPQAEINVATDEFGNPVMKTVFKQDAEGNFFYVVDNTNGTFIKVGTYIADDKGTFVRQYNAIEDANGTDVKNMVYREAADGEYYHNEGYVEDQYNGQFMRTYVWVENAEGEYYHDAGYLEDPNGQYNGQYMRTYQYEENDEGEYCKPQYVKAEGGSYVRMTDYAEAQDGDFYIDYTEDPNGQYIKDRTFTEASEYVEGTDYYVHDFAWTEYTGPVQQGVTYYKLDHYVEDPEGEYGYMNSQYQLISNIEGWNWQNPYIGTRYRYSETPEYVVDNNANGWVNNGYVKADNGYQLAEGEWEIGETYYTLTQSDDYVLYDATNSAHIGATPKYAGEYTEWTPESGDVTRYEIVVTYQEDPNWSIQGVPRYDLYNGDYMLYSDYINHYGEDELTRYNRVYGDYVNYVANTPNSVRYAAYDNGYKTYTDEVGEVTRYNKVYSDYVEWVSGTENCERYSYYDNGYVEYNDEVGEVTRYNLVWDGTYRAYNPSTDEGMPRYNTSYTYRAATDDDAELQHYSVVTSYLDANQEANLIAPDQYRDGNDKYAYETEEVEVMTIINANDYRGWHQFVLTAYATNSNEPFVPYRSYITDNDWWTICVPFDLTKRQLIKLFGKNESVAHADLPYLSKLTYVIRDAKNKNIILNFSKNLLENKEVVEKGHVHGVINEDMEVALDDVVLHAGVPYLIRPNIVKGASRQFDIYKTVSESYDSNKDLVDADLYENIMASQKMGGEELNTLIYNGIYTVPAYVVNNDNVESVCSNNQTFVMGDGTQMQYDKNGTIEYNGVDVAYGISNEFRYSFVGSFFLNLMPKDAYFLGWDSKKNRAAFWYNRVPDTKNWTWNNETGVILPNFVTGNETNTRKCNIDPATGLDDPARWIIDLELEHGDDVIGATNDGAKNHITESRFGYEGNLFDGEATVIMQIDGENIDQLQQNNAKGVYSISGQYMGTSTEGLAKGIYIVNGKKYVIK